MPTDSLLVAPRVDPSAARLAWDGYCADPFVLQTDHGYYMYGTDPTGDCSDGRIFPLLHSIDTVHWTSLGGALEPPADRTPASSFWAPEVVAVDGAFWMYYSIGTEDADHHLRVARAEHPAGPFRDCGANLTHDLPFAIDPSPFRDADGNWWMLFATDDLPGPRPGTVIALTRMVKPDELAPNHRVILRATADWQRYQRDRPMYGGIHDWHTLEGPSIVRHLDHYWLLYSGGNWQGAGYGVAAARATSMTGPWEALTEGPNVLSTDTAHGLRGPGHNSVVKAPDGTDLAVFHAWDVDGERRRPYTAPLNWCPTLTANKSSRGSATSGVGGGHVGDP